ncbi:hypothetical protein [Blastococcus sp. SYSU D00820]
MELKNLAVADLELDADNPRLPEDQQGAPPEEILAYLEQHDVLTELAASFVGNGYFENEPLVVTRSQASGKYTVIEGNRRLATLFILLQHEVAKRAGVVFDLEPPPSEELLGELSTVPCYVTSDRGEVAAFLGYRHISGLRRWSAEAKARYIWRQVNEARNTSPEENPFYTVGRLVGSNARGVRNAYLSFELLRSAKADHGIDTNFVLRERFGVWTRLLGTANVLDHLGVPDNIRTYEDVRNGMTDVSGPRLREVVGDLTPQNDREAVLNDSRDVTIYSRVIANEEARATLRAHGDLATARLLVEQSNLAERVRRLTRACDALALDARRMTIDDSALEAAEELTGACEALELAFRRSNGRAKRAPVA